MAKQSSSRMEGNRYQHLYSWYELLQLLDEDSPYAYGIVEHPGAGSADDVTLYARPGSGKASKFTQIKWHVDHHEEYSFESLIKVISGSRSLLQKLFDSWKQLRTSGPVEIWLVSNWGYTSKLGRVIRGRDHTFSEDFLTCSPATDAGRARDHWKEKLGADDEELGAFCRALRLRLGFGSISDLEEMVDDRMARFRLRMGANPRAIAIDEVATWVERDKGEKTIDRQVLLDTIRDRNLRATPPEAPPVSLWIHGWARRRYDRPPTIELDWTAYFDRSSRQVPDQRTWDEVLFPQLARAREELAQQHGASYIDFRGKLPLSAALAVGAAFPEVGGYSFRAEQPTRGETYLWRSDARPSERHFNVVEEEGVPGEDLLMAFCVTGPAWIDVQGLFEETGTYSAVVYTEVDNGPGGAALRSDADATAIAFHAKDLIRQYRQKYRASRTHLVLYGPAAFCLFLGQRLNALGEVVGYERTEKEGYQPSVRLRTG